MTVSNQSNRISAVGSGAVGQVIPFTFPIIDTSDIVAYSRVTATGVETLLAETTNYTVTINGDSGGSVTTVTAIVTTAEIHLIRAVPFTQSLDLEQGGSFNAENIEDAIDKNTKLTIQNKDGMTRSLRAPETDSTALNLELPNSVDRASKNLGFDASGNVIVTDSSGSFTTTDTQSDTQEDGDDVITESPFADVRAFGAIGDGTTDDTAAFNLAIATGKAILIPPLTFVISDTLTQTAGKDIILVGTGDSSLINFSDATEELFDVTPSSTTGRLVLRNLKITCTSAGYSGNLITINGGAVSSPLFRQVHIFDVFLQNTATNPGADNQGVALLLKASGADSGIIWSTFEDIRIRDFDTMISIVNTGTANGAYINGNKFTNVQGDRCGKMIHLVGSGTSSGINDNKFTNISNQTLMHALTANPFGIYLKSTTSANVARNRFIGCRVWDVTDTITASRGLKIDLYNTNNRNQFYACEYDERFEWGTVEDLSTVLFPDIGFGMRVADRILSLTAPAITYYLDEADTTGTASDVGNGSTAATPFLTWERLTQVLPMYIPEGMDLTVRIIGNLSTGPLTFPSMTVDGSLEIRGHTTVAAAHATPVLNFQGLKGGNSAADPQIFIRYLNLDDSCNFYACEGVKISNCTVDNASGSIVAAFSKIYVTDITFGTLPAVCIKSTLGSTILSSNHTLGGKVGVASESGGQVVFLNNSQPTGSDQSVTIVSGGGAGAVLSTKSVVVNDGEVVTYEDEIVTL